MDLETAEAIEHWSERIDSLESSFRADFRNGLGELRTELRNELAEVRRHAVLLNEATRDDIRLVAEAVAAIAAKID